jgi:tetratricopeptide (TPR) repeat protein
MKEQRNAPRLWWICLALAAITLALYSPLFHYDFLTYDDQIYVTENPYVLSGLNWNSIAWAFHTSTSGNWLPLTWLSHMLDVQFFGLKAGGHHVTNVLLHAANAVLLFLLLQKMTGAAWRCAIVAALFAWHPAHVESVAWIAERKDVLSAFFGFLTILAYLRYVEESKLPGGKGKIFFATTVLLFAFGLMAKSMLVTVPLVLLLLDFWPLGRLPRSTFARLLVEKIPFFVLSAACCGVTIWAQRQGHAVASVESLYLSHRFFHVFASYWRYLAMLIYPHNLAIFYPYYPAQESMLPVIAGALVVVAISALAFAWAGRRPWLATGWFWFLGMLVPVIGLVQVGDQSMADRYTYLPAIGFFIVVVWTGAELAERWPAIKFLAPLACVASLAGAWPQIHYWQDTKVLFRHAAQVTEKNFVALTLLGSFDDADGDADGAIKLYQEALTDQPNYSMAHFFLAKTLEEQGNLDQAEAEFQTALRLNPSLEQGHIFLGLLLAREKKYDQAEAEYEAALQLNPRSAVAHNDLAHVLQSEGRLDESAAHYLAAIQYDSSLAQAHNNLGVVYLQEGRAADAVVQLREALRLNPENMETEYNLALALNHQQQWQEAAEIWQRIAPAQQKNAQAQYQYGLALEHEGKIRQAMSQFAYAILLTPDFAEALNAMAWIAATDPHPELRNGPQAVGMASQACNLTGRQRPELLLTLAAAYAEAGNFENAVATANQAEKIAGETNAELEKKVVLMRGTFQARQPFRETPAASQ